MQIRHLPWSPNIDDVVASREQAPELPCCLQQLQLRFLTLVVGLKPLLHDPQILLCQPELESGDLANGFQFARTLRLTMHGELDLFARAPQLDLHPLEFALRQPDGRCRPWAEDGPLRLNADIHVVALE